MSLRVEWRETGRLPFEPIVGLLQFTKSVDPVLLALAVVGVITVIRTWLLLVRVFRSLDPLVGSDVQKRHDWLRSPNKALNGTPALLIETPYGLVTTLSYLDGMRAAA